MNNTCTTAEIYSVDTVVPDGSRSTIVVGENLWLGPKDGWKQGSGVTLIKADGTPERLAYDSAYKSFLALDECDLLNLLPCPAVLDAGDIRTQIVKAWKEGRTVTVPWTKSDKVLLLGEVSIEGQRSPRSTNVDATASLAANGEHLVHDNPFASGVSGIDSYCATIRSISKKDGAHTKSGKYRILISQVPVEFSGPSVGWEINRLTRELVYRTLENFGGETTMKSIVDVPVHKDGICYTKWSAQPDGQMALRKSALPRNGDHFYYSIATSTSNTKFGSVYTAKQSDAMLPSKGTLKYLEERMRDGPVRVKRLNAQGSVASILVFSKDPGGLLASQFQDVERNKLEIKGEAPWSLENQHRIICKAHGLE